MNICRLLSFVTSLWIERPERMPASLRRHVDRCDSCRRSFGAELEVAHRLPAATLPAGQRLPPSLQQRILARVRAEEPTSPWSPRFVGRWVASGAAIGVCVAFLVLLMPRAGHETATWVEPDRIDAAPTASFNWPTATALNQVAGADLLRWGQSVHAPLELEWARAVEDGHRLLAVVVQSCVPDPAADALLSRTRQMLPAPAAWNLTD